MSSASDLFDLTGRGAIVTGASSGLGAVFARALAEAGARVVVAARRTDRIEALAAELNDGGAEAIAVTCDVTDAAQVDALIAQTGAAFGRVDIMINNAGTAGDGGPTPERLPHMLFEQTVRVNLFGTWYGCQAAAAHMLADGRGGSIINVSSVLGLGGQQNYPVGYMASKAAVINLTRALAVSWGDRGVRVNALAPGWFPSEMTEGYFGIPAFMAAIQDAQPTGRVGRPEELIGPLLFLASDASSYVSGHTLTVDGGLSASYGASQWSEELRATFAAIIPDGLGTPIVAA